jgi:hypothetical protein
MISIQIKIQDENKFNVIQMKIQIQCQNNLNTFGNAFCLVTGDSTTGNALQVQCQLRCFYPVEESSCLLLKTIDFQVKF